MESGPGSRPGPKTGPLGGDRRAAGRYELFARLHRETGCKVATAHTLSDNMETLLFRMARGTGLRGMRGILPVRDYLCRPLIGCTRREIEDYCAEQGLDHVQDSTNFLPDYTRNRIRMELIPGFMS